MIRKLLSFLGVMAFALTITTTTSHAQLTAWTYQGSLSDENGPANGLLDMSFGLFTTATGGTAVSTVTNTSVSVSNGLFTTTLDFGATVFDGADYWLEIGIIDELAVDPLVTLSPRQPLTATPYAIRAATVSEIQEVDPTFTSSPVAAIDSTQIDSWNTSVSWGNHADAGYQVSGDPVDNLIIRNPSLNGALILSPSTAGLGVDPELVIQSAETGGGNNAPFHISRNAIFQTSDDTYQYVDDVGAAASKMEYGTDGTIKFSSATSGIGQVTFTDNMVITVNGDVGIATTDPNSRLDVNGTVSASRFKAGNDTDLSGENGFIGGGIVNTNSGVNAGLVAGQRNIVQGNRSFIGGGRFNFISSGATDDVIGGGQGNQILSNGGSRGINSVIAGGRTNICSQTFGVIGGGRLNVITNNDSSSILFSTIGGGDGNFAAGCSGTIAGGWNNTNVAGFAPTVGGGRRNVADGNYTTVGGGRDNMAIAGHATIPGGRDNEASGAYSFAAGRRAKAVHDGAFVWADNSNADLSSEADNQFVARASGGFTLRTADNATSGVRLPAGGSAWLILSDRKTKEQVEPLDQQDVLEKLSKIPMNTWKYKSQSAGIRHAGPMAQDFYAAFGLGEDERYLNSSDVDGIALAAVQGLNQKLEEKLAEKEREIHQLRMEMQELKKMVSSMSQ